MGFFSNLFAPRELTAEEIAANKMALLSKKLRDLTVMFAHKRISMQEGENVVPFEKLQKLSDFEVSCLPENNIVLMAGLYRRCIGEGANHEIALKIVNSTRVIPVKWNDTSKFQTIELYIAERLKVELAAPSLSSTTLKYFTQDFISDSVQKTNRIFQDIFG